MSDDEFGFDDDTFDAADLAKLDEIEQKYIATASQIAPPPRPAPIVPSKPPADRFIRSLPAKRIRPNEWNESSRPNRIVQDEDDNDPPQLAIVATKDGKYRAIDPNEPNARAISLAVPSTLPPRTASDAPARQNPMPPPPPRRVEQTPTPAYSQGHRDSSTDVIGSSSARFAAITAALQETDLNDGGEDEIAQLRAEIAKLKISKEAVEASLKAAKEEKWTKEGEISTMRRNMTKIQSSHAEILQKLQQEKLAAEEKRKQQERQMNQEMERLKSSLALRRQELETSVRKTPWSVRKHPSMMPTPARTRDPHRLSVHETPSRRSPLKASQSRFAREESLKNTTSKKNKGKMRAFDSFVDSFQDNSPVKARPQARVPGNAKGKGRVPNMEEMFPPIEQPEEPALTQADAATKDNSFSFPSTQVPARNPSVVDWGDDAPDLMLEFEQEADTQEVDAVVEDMVLHEMDEEEPLEMMDMKDQCTRLLFSHTSLPSYQFTLQILLSTRIPEEPPGSPGRYVQSCSSLIEALGSRTSDYDTLIRQVLSSLLEISQILSLANSSVSLAGLLNLLATICLFLPGTTAMLLPEVNNEGSLLLSVLGAVVRGQAAPASLPYTNERELLIKECINFFEVLCLTVPKESSQQLRFFLQDHGVISNLLDDRQPLWLLEGTTRALGILCSDHENFRFILSFPTSSPEGKEPKKDPTRIPILERLSYMLVETKSIKRYKDHIPLQLSILTCLTQLAIASPDALSILMASQALIPALVTNLNNCTTIVWDGDEDQLNGGTLIYNLQIIQGSLQLLHHLIFRAGEEFDLQRKLQYPPQKFNGLEHMFVIGLGRLSYADPPEWQNIGARELAESSADLARDLLEHVVDGPEVDAIWASYQGAGNSQDDSQTEDDEMEALKVAPSAEDMVLVD